MFGYKKIKWDRPSKNTWVSPDGQYRIDMLDAITYCPSKQMEDHTVRSRYAFSKLAQAKKWCDKECEKDYLHNLQLHINQTNRYGS